MSFTISSCVVLVSPGEVDAGAEMTLTGEVVCSPAQDLRGRRLQIRDHEGALVDQIQFTEFDGEVNLTEFITVKAPDEPGTHIWFAVPPEEPDEAESGDGFRSDQATPFSVTVTPHTTRLLVWDVPAAVEIGQSFALKIGLKCSSGCDMTGRLFEILDHAGEHVGAGALTAELWPGSEGLYLAELELTAPDTEGLFRWQVQVSTQEAEIPHRAATAGFGVRAVVPADCIVRIEAVDREEEQPLPNMSVVMHPYRAMTNERGMAEIKVAKGTYSVFVSGRGYYPVQRDLKVTQDITTRASLEAEPPPSKDW
jgi:hypothetical protein